MEELTPDSIKPKNIVEKTEIKNDTDETREKAEENDLEIKKKESSDNIDPKKELEKIRQSHVQQYSFLELFRQSIIFSAANMKLPLFNILRKFLSNYIDIRIPVIYGKLLNTIIKEKNYEKLCYEFKWNIIFLFLRAILGEVGEKRSISLI